jgi:cell division protein FtsB
MKDNYMQADLTQQKSYEKLVKENLMLRQEIQRLHDLVARLQENPKYLQHIDK